MGLSLKDLRHMPQWARDHVKAQMVAQGIEDHDTKKPGPAQRFFGYLLHNNADRQRKLNSLRQRLIAVRADLHNEGLTTAAKAVELAEASIIEELVKHG